MISSLRALGATMEVALAGQLPAAIRKNMLVELWVGMAYGAFYAMTIPFIPVLLRRSGATPEMLAEISASWIPLWRRNVDIALMKNPATPAALLTAKILDTYARKRDGLLSRQTDERQAERQVQFAATRSITVLSSGPMMPCTWPASVALFARIVWSPTCTSCARCT